MYSQQCFSRRGRGAGRRDGGRVVREIQQPQPSTHSRRERGAGRGQSNHLAPPRLEEHNRSVEDRERLSFNLQNNANKRRRLDQQQDGQPVEMNMQHQDETQIVEIANTLH